MRWARAMPSPVCRNGRGLTALDRISREFPSTARAEVRKLFALVGQVLEIPEKRFDAFTVTFSSSHGYQRTLATLIAAAKAVGLDGKVAAGRRGSCAGGWDCGVARRRRAAG